MSQGTHDDDLMYDVFVSFRGADTRRGFVDHLYKTLIDANLTTFLDDDEIIMGRELGPEIERAIKTSRASIIVLSENYGSSRWCLDELVLIMEQHRTSNQIVFPIFYHVNPSDVRKQRGCFGDPMEVLGERIIRAESNADQKSYLAHKMEKWIKALTDVAKLAGFVATDRQERKFIQEVVEHVSLRLYGQSTITTLPLLYGMEDSVKFITSWLNDGSSFHTTDILTILGMVGIGKTYLANYIYGKYSRLFDKSSFIEDIDAKCAVNVKELLELQKQLCVDIVQEVRENTFRADYEPAHRKVFIVLDDIGSLQQLDELIGNKCFHPGSKIMITTRDVSVTQRCASFNSKVQPKHTSLVLQGLPNNASLQLLSHHAFMSKGPEKSYERVAEKIIAYCQGHPLALQLLGESLRKRSVAEWEDYIENLKEEPDSLINSFLQKSFDSLPSEDDKELFKHIACFFVGEDREFTETILQACDVSAIHGIKNLIDRCLLVIGPSNELQMHQLLQEMGRDVVCQESPDKPHKRSRLWCHKESFEVLKQKKGKGNLLGLALDMKMLEKEELHGSVELKTNALSKMDNLKLLQLNYVHQLKGSYKNFPEELRWLCMHGFPLKSIPSDLRMENLVALDMSFSALESFDMSCSNPHQSLEGEILQQSTESCSEDEIPLRSLKILNLSFCKQLRSLGGFSKLPALERLILANCTGLVEVCESIEQCDELVLIDLRYCNMLEKFPTTMFNKVRTLLVEGCYLGGLPIDTS